MLRQWAVISVRSRRRAPTCFGTIPSHTVRGELPNLALRLPALADTAETITGELVRHGDLLVRRPAKNKAAAWFGALGAWGGAQRDDAAVVAPVDGLQAGRASSVCSFDGSWAGRLSPTAHSATLAFNAKSCSCDDASCAKASPLRSARAGRYYRSVRALQVRSRCVTSLDRIWVFGGLCRCSSAGMSSWIESATAREGIGMVGQVVDVVVVDSPDGFEHVVMQIAPIVSRIADELQCPAVRVTAVLTPDFGVEVEATWARSGIEGLAFTDDRLGGLVRAKTMPVVADYTQVHIVFNQRAWPTEPTLGQLFEWYFLTAHELTHAVLGRLRHASGAADGIPFPSRTPRECARSIARAAVEEFRCDLTADMITRNFVKAEIDGEPRGFGMADIMGGGYGEALEAILEQRVHPGWPDVVERYRTWEISLESMWDHIIRETDQLMTTIAHSEAEAYASGADLLMTQTRFLGKLGAEMYVAPAWNRIFKAIDGDAIVPNLSEFAEAERKISGAGEQALLEMWSTLGITVIESEDRSFALEVTDPRR